MFFLLISCAELKNISFERKLFSTFNHPVKMTHSYFVSNSSSSSPAEGIMGCVGSKKEQETLGKSTGSDDLLKHPHTAHYVKDPTAGTRAVSEQPDGNIQNSDPLLLLFAPANWNT